MLIEHISVIGRLLTEVCIAICRNHIFGNLLYVAGMTLFLPLFLAVIPLFFEPRMRKKPEVYQGFGSLGGRDSAKNSTN